MSSTSVRLGLALALTAFVALLSLIPGTPVEGDSQLVVSVAAVPPALQNAMHLVLYGVLAVLWSWALERGHGRFALAAAGVIAYGCVLELAQLAVPGRFASLLDVALNTAGAALATLALRVRRA
jgi:hypothetical protein